jgi:putative holliday junction resolvase
MNNDPLAKPSSHAVYLGFDYGDKNIGVAVGQSISGTATGLETIQTSRNEAKWQAIARLIDVWQPKALVVGLSYQLDGSENPITQPILRFCRQLQGRYGLPVHTMDETLSTIESKAVFYRERSKRSQSFGAYKDQISAQLILQSWLNQTIRPDSPHG